MNNSTGIAVPEGCVTKQFFKVIPWDNKDTVVSKEVDDIVKVVIMGLCLPLLFTVSFCTNIISMIVFYKHGLKERINACLFTLSLVDLLGISVAFGFSSDVMYMFVTGKQGELGPSYRFFVQYYLVGLYGLVTSSQVVYSVIAVERCLCITHPLLVKSFMSTKTTVVMLWAVVVVISGGSVFVIGVRYGILCVFNPSNDSVFYVNYPTDFYFRHRFIMDITYSVVLGVFFPGLSFLSVTVCTIVTTVELRKLSTWRETVSSASGSVSSKDLVITRVILGTSILFIICIVPAVVLRSSFFIVPELKVGGRYDNLVRIFTRCYILLSAINNTFNFFIYYAYGSRFRDTTRRLFTSYHRLSFTKKKTKV